MSICTATAVVTELQRDFIRFDTEPARSTMLVSRTVPLRLVDPPEQPALRAPARSELSLLGGFRLMIDDVVLTTGPAVQRMLAALACLGGHSPRAKLARTLWPDATTERSHSNLRTTLYRLQRQAPGLVLTSKTDVRFAPEVRVDIEGTRAYALTLLNMQLDDKTEPLPLVPWTELGRDLLPDWDDRWLIEHQSSYRRLRLDALERLADLLSFKKQYGAAVQAALAVINADPLRENAHEQLIRAYLAQGNRNDAISHYAGYCKTLREEIGLDPARSVNELLWSQAC